jgi:5-methylcytosine-specific restriction endonuclease McrA
LRWPATAGAYRRLRQRLAEEGIDVSAYPGQAWRAGRTDLARIPIDQMLVNGDRRDNRLENLRLLCPNCHAQTPTYRGRNIGRIDLLVTALGS